MLHGFVRDPARKITTFSVPRGLNGAVVYSINDEGAIVGSHTAELNALHGASTTNYNVGQFRRGGAPICRKGWLLDRRRQ